jgi:hypothetical protein
VQAIDDFIEREINELTQKIVKLNALLVSTRYLAFESGFNFEVLPLSERTIRRRIYEIKYRTFSSAVVRKCKAHSEGLDKWRGQAFRAPLQTSG